MKILRTLSFLGLCLAVSPAVAEQPGDRFLERPRQLTYAGARAGEGYFSPDGSKLVFQSEREAGNPFYQIYELNLETGDTRRVTKHIERCCFTRCPTG